MSKARSRHFGPLLTLLALSAILACSCSEDTPTGDEVPEDLLPAYYIETGSVGHLIGWAKIPVSLSGDGSLLESIYYLDGHPFENRVEILWETGPADPHYDWSLGREGGPWLEGRIDSDEERGGWGYVLSGWGELQLESTLEESATMPLVFDPLSPLSYALVARRWRESEATDSLNLTLFFLADARATPVIVNATLHDEGAEIQNGIPLLTFSLELAGEQFFIKIMEEQFPIPYITWWEGRQLSLRFVGDQTPVFDHEASPFPPPDGYSRSALGIPSGDLTLGGERRLPEGEGPFPACLILDDAGPTDQESAPLLGYIAHELARAGWLVYRPDKPGTGASTGALDTLDLGGRRRALAELWPTLLAEPLVDIQRLLLVGHGEGAALALEFAATSVEVGAVIALAPPSYDPALLPAIPEADAAQGDFIRFLGRDCFIGKYEDLRVFDSDAYLAGIECPVALYRGELDETVGIAELEAQAAAITGDDVRVRHFENLGHYFNPPRHPESPPATALIDEISDWLNQQFGGG
jgi:pimeloyl-ACP methyl ester carboxylesterase